MNSMIKIIKTSIDLLNQILNDVLLKKSENTIMYWFIKYFILKYIFIIFIIFTAEEKLLITSNLAGSLKSQFPFALILATDSIFES